MSDRDLPDGTRFSSLLDLERLPWFERGEGGRLVVSDRSVGPCFDFHTHVALAYVLPVRVDLHRETPDVDHYLDTHGTIELDVYANQNWSAERLKAIQKDLTLGSLSDRGMRATHTFGNLVREGTDLGFRGAAVLPIDFPALSHNSENVLEGAPRHPGLVPFGSVHPYARHLEARLDAQLRGGARGIKVHPAVQLVRPDDRRAMRLYRLCGERRVPIVFHCGPVGIEARISRYLSQVRFYEKPIRDNPDTTFVLGHSGALQWREALDLAKRYPNVVLETSSQSVSALRTIVAEADPERVVLGSDWPFYPQAFALAKALMVTEGRPELRRAILYGNAARLLGLPS